MTGDFSIDPGSGYSKGPAVTIPAAALLSARRRTSGGGSPGGPATHFRPGDFPACFRLMLCADLSGRAESFRRPGDALPAGRFPACFRLMLCADLSGRASSSPKGLPRRQLTARRKTGYAP